MFQVQLINSGGCKSRVHLKDSYSTLCIEDTAASSTSNDAIVQPQKILFDGYLTKSFLHLINTINNTRENIFCFFSLRQPIKFLLKRMQRSALKVFLFPVFSIRKGTL